jgi:hypothetical protein
VAAERQSVRIKNGSQKDPGFVPQPEKEKKNVFKKERFFNFSQLNLFLKRSV